MSSCPDITEYQGKYDRQMQEPEPCDTYPCAICKERYAEDEMYTFGDDKVCFDDKYDYLMLHDAAYVDEYIATQYDHANGVSMREKHLWEWFVNLDGDTKTAILEQAQRETLLFERMHGKSETQDCRREFCRDQTNWQEYVEARIYADT